MTPEPRNFATLNEAFKFLDEERIDLEARQKVYQHHVHELFKQLAEQLQERQPLRRKKSKS